MNKSDFESLKTNEEREQLVLDVCHETINKRQFDDLLEIITTLQTKWNGLSSARLTKIIKNVFDYIPITMKTYNGILSFLEGLIEWANDKKMLKLDLQCKQIFVFLNIGKYAECLLKITEVVKDLKKYDDKINLISLYVYESRAYYELKDFAKARSSLTSARALAVSAACPPQLQAQIDILNGMYICDEHIYDTAISYFMESLEGFIQDKMYENAKVPLRYIILCKILGNKFNEITSVLESKYTANIKDDDFTQVLIEVANACKKRELNQYRSLLSAHGNVIESDSFVYKHLQYLYHILLDQNILKIIEPYSHIKISFLASKLGFDENVIEDKLRKMILDKDINGILDHDSQCLVLFENVPKSKNIATQCISILESYYGKI